MRNSVDLPLPFGPINPTNSRAEDVAELRGFGWSERAIADVVGLVTRNLLTGAFNLVAGIVTAEDDAASG